MCLIKSYVTQILSRKTYILWNFLPLKKVIVSNASKTGLKLYSDIIKKAYTESMTTDSSPTGQFADRTVHRQDFSPTGQFADRTVCWQDSSLAGQFADRNFRQQDSLSTIRSQIRENVASAFNWHEVYYVYENNFLSLLVGMQASNIMLGDWQLIYFIDSHTQIAYGFDKQ